MGTSLHFPIRVISPESEGHFEAKFTPASMDRATAIGLRVSPFYRTRRILTAQTLEAAVRGCDTYAVTKVVHGPMALG